MSERPSRYRVDDQSILLGVYQRLLWDRLTPLIPAAIAPNALTVTGLVLGVLAAVTCAVAVTGHTLFYLVSAFCLMASLTLDNVDGAHARRTGQCSRRGELLDHGLDGITSTSVLVITALLLHMGDVMMAVFCALGALTFASAFWEQFRTGVLTLPKVGPTEGVTAVAVWEILVAVFGDPAWLQFSTERVTAGTVIVALVVLVHAVAIAPPFVRAAKRGVTGWEIAPLFALVALQLGFVLLGASGIVAAVTMGLLCAGTTCHMIVLRHRGEQGPVVPRSLYLAAAPLCVLVSAPHTLPALAASLLALAVVIAGYALTVRRGWALLGAQSVAS